MEVAMSSHWQLQILTAPPPSPQSLLKKQRPAGSFSAHKLNNIYQGGVRKRVVTGQNPQDGRPLGYKV